MPSLRGPTRLRTETSLQQLRCRWADHAIYLKDVLTRLPTHKASQIEELLPHLWKPAGGISA